MRQWFLQKPLLRHRCSQTQVPEGQQRVEGVFGIGVFVAPMTMERTLVRPERIDKIEAILSNSLERNLHAGERMQSSSGGKHIRHRRFWGGNKASLRMMSSQDPIADGSVNRHREVPQQSHRRSRRIRRTELCAAVVGPCAVVAFERL